MPFTAKPLSLSGEKSGVPFGVKEIPGEEDFWIFETHSARSKIPVM
jgi:hypothetical protein